MATIELVARNGDAVHQAIELGDLVHMDTASEELTDEFLLFAVNSGLFKTWADAFPDPRQEAEIGMEVLLAASSSARFAGLYSFRKRGDVLQSARVLGALGYSVAVTQGGQGRSRYGRCAGGQRRWVEQVVGSDGTDDGDRRGGPVRRSGRGSLGASGSAQVAARGQRRGGGAWLTH